MVRCCLQTRSLRNTPHANGKCGNASTFTQHLQAPARRLRRAVSDMDLVNQAWSVLPSLVQREQTLYAELIGAAEQDAQRICMLRGGSRVPTTRIDAVRVETVNRDEQTHRRR